MEEARKKLENINPDLVGKDLPGMLLNEDLINNVDSSFLANYCAYWDSQAVWYVVNFLFNVMGYDEEKKMLLELMQKMPENISEGLFLKDVTEIAKEVSHLYLENIIKRIDASKYTLEDFKREYDLTSFLKSKENIRLSENNREMMEFIEKIKYLCNTRQLSYQDPIILEIVTFFQKKMYDYCEKKDQDSFSQASITLISALLSGELSLTDFTEHYNFSSRALKSLICCLKFHKKDDSYNLITYNKNLDALLAVKGKNVLQLVSVIKEVNEKLQLKISNNTILEISLNLELLFGVQKGIQIVKYFSNDRKKSSYILLIFKNLNLEHIHAEHNTIPLNEDFIQFIMGKDIKDPTSVLNSYITYDRDSSNIITNLDKVHLNWKELNMRYQSQSLDGRKKFIARTVTSTKVLLLPSEYLLEGDIMNFSVDDKKFRGSSEKDVVEKTREYYREQRKRYFKTIPYVEGSLSGYHYETLKSNDPTLYKLGTITGCCFKVGGDADSFVQYCALDPNGRVLVIRNNTNKIVAFVPMARNGNVILANSIESSHVKDANFMDKMTKIVEQAAQEMIQISGEKEPDTKIEAFVVGGYKNDNPELKKHSLSTRYIRTKELSPLDDNVYANLGNIDYCSYFLETVPGFQEENIHSFIPNHYYLDKRMESIEIEKEYVTEDTIKKCNAIYYEVYGKTLEVKDIYKIVLGEDWFILVDNSMSITSACLNYDIRAEEEYQEYMALMNEFLSYKGETRLI